MSPQRISVARGERYARLTVLCELAPQPRPGSSAARMVLARCDCGNEKPIRLTSLRSGNTESCGCLQKEKAAAQFSVPINKKHGQTGSALYGIWRSMRKRCYDKNNNRYALYGGRGITVCDAWRESFELFRRDVGDRPPGMSIDRIDNDGNYEPGNVRWATPKEQAANRRKPTREAA